MSLADPLLVASWVFLGAWSVVWLFEIARTMRHDHPVRPVARMRVLVSVGFSAALITGQAALVDLVADSSGPPMLDQTVFTWFVGHRNATATAVMTAASAAGGSIGMAALSVAAVSLLLRHRRRVEALVVSVAGLAAAVLVIGFKYLYGRPRPPAADQLVIETNASMPSGHALGSLAVLGVLALVAALESRHTAVRIVVFAIAASLAGLVGVSRLYLGVHWVTDIAVGWLLGGVVLSVCATALSLARVGSERSN